MTNRVRVLTCLLSVREILPELVSQLVKLSSSDEFEQQEVSSFPLLNCVRFSPARFVSDGDTYDRRAVPQVWRKARGRDHSGFAAYSRVA